MYIIDGIQEDSLNHRYGLNKYTHVGKSALKIKDYKTLGIVPGSFKDAVEVFYNARFASLTETEDSKGATADSEDSSSSMILPPSERYTTIITDEAQDFANQVSNLATKQFVQQFYEVYMVPIGQMEVYNRLGQISGVVNDIHQLFPKGVEGLIGSDLRASWRTNIHYEFNINEGVKDSYGNDIHYTYSSLAFPPFIEHETVNVNDFSEMNIEGDQASTAFDMTNILYKRNTGTFRFAAFKQVNDNIRILQLFLNRCFGIESTYLNEWDLSLYMQEGLCSFTTSVNDDGTELKTPQYVTTLTYGLMDDAPTAELLDSRGGVKDVDIGKITPFASINMAVSTRYGVDNEPISTKCCEQIYEINKFPLSAYWFPSNDGVTDDEMNVPKFIRKMLAFDQTGYAFNQDDPTGKFYTNKIYHGGDFANSTKSFLNILKYYDNRRALTSGWSGVDENGEKYLRDSDTTNRSFKSNTFSYLPYWKQFYSTPEDGMSEIDLYHQEIIAAASEKSIINFAYQVINITTSGNTPFQDFCEAKAKEDLEQKLQTKFDDEDNPFNMTIPPEYGVDSFSDMSFSLFKCKLKIPGSKLLNMFLNKGKKTSSAMSMANSMATPDMSTPGGGSGSGSGGSKTPSGLLKGAGPVATPKEPKTIEVDGVLQEVQEYEIEDDSDFSEKKTVGDGVIESSPLLYGGPHGQYYSPLTLEGYCQAGNENLTTVPTMDAHSMFYGSIYSNIRGFEHTKNFKNSGSYADVVTAITPNEREAVCNASQQFGIRINAGTERQVAYRTGTLYPKYVWARNRYRWYWWWYWLDFNYYKTFKFTNGWISGWIWWSREYGQSAYGKRWIEYRKEDNVPFQPDDTSSDFSLIPVLWGQNSGKYVNRASDIIWHRSHDDNRYLDGTFYDRYRDSGNKIGMGACLKYLVSLGGNPSRYCGAAFLESQQRYDSYKHFVPYYNGNIFDNRVRNLYLNGYRRVWVTLPIKDPNTNKVLTLVCGVASLEEGRTLGWSYVLVRHYTWGWRRRHHWCHYHCYYYRREYYRWEWKLTYKPTYNMYFWPNMIKYNLPSETLIDREYIGSEPDRNKNSSNIIERYGLNMSKSFMHVNRGTNAPQLFPFTTSFMEKYGRRTNVYCQGWSWSHGEEILRNYPILHTKGMYWGNMAEEFATSGEVKVVESVAPYIKTYKGNVSYVEEILGGRSSTAGSFWGYIARLLGSRHVKTSLQTVKTTTTFTSASAFYKPSQTHVSEEFTNYFRDCFKWKAIQRYQDNYGAHSVWYNPIDHFDVYIDTATQQIAWLKQLRDYADLYLRDSLIMELYKKSVDKHTQDMIEKEYSGEPYSAGWTDSYTEDICYDDGLALARRIFVSEDPEANSIRDMCDDRISILTSLKNGAQKLRDSFNSNPKDSSEKFMKLVTNTYAILENATTNGVTARTALIDENGNYDITVPSAFEVNESSVFDIQNHPAAAMFAYLNILYHVRKYWTNMRFNKRAGSYWNLRSLERVLVFMKANDIASDDSQTPEKSIPNGSSVDLKKSKIHFVQPRSAFKDLTSGESNKAVMTKAVYVKVNYLTNPDPHSSVKWNAEKQLFDGKEIAYVDEVYKYAYKPQDGLYYVMSKTILTRIQSFLDSMSMILTEIGTKTYIPIQKDLLDLRSIGKDFTDLFEIDEERMLEDYYQDCRSIDSRTSQTNAVERFNDFQNSLAKLKKDDYESKVNAILFPIYIRWRPEHVWTGLDENDANGDWHIDINQYEKTKDVDRQVIDPWKNTHNKNEAISAGITFGVAASLNPETLLSNPDALKTSTILEILCSALNNIDLWRVEIPEEEDIPTYLLKDDPVLVPAFQIDATLQPFMNKRPTPTLMSVLVGNNNNILPIQEASLDMLTVNSMAALGEFKDLSQAGMNVGGQT